MEKLFISIEYKIKVLLLSHLSQRERPSNLCISNQREGYAKITSKVLHIWWLCVNDIETLIIDLEVP